MKELNKKIMYHGTDQKDITYFESLTAPPLSAFLPMSDINTMYMYVTSTKYSSNYTKLTKAIDEIMSINNMKRLAGGTNRLVYVHNNFPDYVVKVATNRISINDNFAERIVQERIKPFCAKCFDISPMGNIGIFERVTGVKSRDEFNSLWGNIRDILNDISKTSVFADMGYKYMFNWGFREGFGPVVLDYPYIYSIDRDKLYCDAIFDGHKCGGDIVQDENYQGYHCAKCGRIFAAKDLGITNLFKRDDSILRVKAEVIHMKVSVILNGKVIRTVTTDDGGNKFIMKKTKGMEKSLSLVDSNNKVNKKDPNDISFSIVKNGKVIRSYNKDDPSVDKGTVDGSLLERHLKEVNDNPYGFKFSRDMFPNMKKMVSDTKVDEPIMNSDDVVDNDFVLEDRDEIMFDKNCEEVDNKDTVLETDDLAIVSEENIDDRDCVSESDDLNMSSDEDTIESDIEPDNSISSIDSEDSVNMECKTVYKDEEYKVNIFESIFKSKKIELE